jgi:glyoxylase-like metal-dependent hydrolase (beta-lactamase superfamily II)
MYFLSKGGAGYGGGRFGRPRARRADAGAGRDQEEKIMPAFICAACGTQYPPTEGPPARCPTCADERQYIPPGGQAWTTLERLEISHLNGFRQYEPGLIGIGTQPKFAIGQRALLVCTPAGNILWDCISLIDAATITLINGLGGLRAIAISHPHFYTTLVEWSRAFADVPVYLHADDADWVRRPDGCIKFWQGETFELIKGVALIRGGGHFPGGAMLHWAAGADGKGVVCSADIATVNLDRKSFTFMRSYPNNIPLSEKAVRAIGAALLPCAFDRVYSHHFERVIPTGAKQILQQSIERYCAAIAGAYDRPEVTALDRGGAPALG